MKRLRLLGLVSLALLSVAGCGGGGHVGVTADLGGTIDDGGSDDGGYESPPADDGGTEDPGPGTVDDGGSGGTGLDDGLGGGSTDSGGNSSGDCDGGCLEDFARRHGKVRVRSSAAARVPAARSRKR